jgi:hypothetical protein
MRQFDSYLRDEPVVHPLPSDSLPPLASTNINNPFASSIPDIQSQLPSLNPLPSSDPNPFLLGKRGSTNFSLNPPLNELPGFVNINVKISNAEDSEVCTKKVKQDFENVMLKIQAESKSQIKLNFVDLSRYVPEDNLDQIKKENTCTKETNDSSMMTEPKNRVKFGEGFAKHQKRTQANSLNNPLRNPNDIVIQCFLENAYLGEVGEGVLKDRKKTLSKLLLNISKTFQFENNLSTTIKNLITFENLHIRITRHQFSQLSFQVKTTLFFRYWFQLVDYNWFKISFENVSQKLKITKPDFILEISKE